MIVQWCVKGVGGIDPDGWRRILTKSGLTCRWWQLVDPLPSTEIPNRLTPGNLDRHVNNYWDVDPQTRKRVCDRTPFISLASGCVERHKLLRTNQIHRAKRTALRFATENGTRDGFLFYCYVLVSLNPAVAVPGVAEEVRELNSYRRYSPYQLEGEITAKIQVPPAQIAFCEKWTATGRRPKLRRDWTEPNPVFEHPRAVANIRELF